MRFVQRAIARPNHCAVFPQLGTDHPKGYIDSGNELTSIDPHIYTSVEAVEQMAQLIGIPTRDELTEAQAALAEQTAKADALEAELESLREFKASVDVIESAQFRARKKPGPKKTLERSAA